MYELIKKRWQQSSRKLAQTDAFWERTAAGTALLRDLKDALSKHATGRLIDAGAGSLPYRRLAKRWCTEYRSSDVTATHPDLDFVCDITSLPTPDHAFDTILCTQVLEHVPDPLAALQEFHRVLKPSGKTILSVPHYWYLHNEPHDYFRFTKYGITTLLNRAGFHVISLKRSAGLISFVHDILATAVTSLSYGIPIIWPLISKLIQLTGRLSVWLDEHGDKRGLLALNYVVVAKPSSSQ